MTTDTIKKIKIEEVIEKCKGYMEQQVSGDELSEYINQNIYVSQYMPLSKKYLLINDLLFNMELGGSEDLVAIGIQVTKFKFFNVMLEYTNIDIGEGNNTIENYDILFPVLYGMILPVIYNDYTVFEKLLNDVAGFNNMKSMIDYIATSYDGEEEAGKTLEDSIKKLKNNEDIINKALEIMKYNQ